MNPETLIVLLLGLAGFETFFVETHGAWSAVSKAITVVCLCYLAVQVYFHNTEIVP